MEPRRSTAVVLNASPKIDDSLMSSPQTSHGTILSWATAELTKDDNYQLTSHLDHGIVVLQEWSASLGSWDGRCHHSALILARHALRQVHDKIRQIQVMDEEGWKGAMTAPCSTLARFQQASFMLDVTVLECSVKAMRANDADTDAVDVSPEQMVEFCAKVDPLKFLVTEANLGLSLFMDISADLAGEDPVTRLFPNGRNLQGIDEVEEIRD
ncbi:hypothetical protein AK830_g4240 [Neonectria ditissima]|uniref:Uncharacterized protein n=1 Tax=Neonectria ditissima TaxID=78410 RepID=A0A0P7B6V7_9HYPO|nr:hypothetical protein AK830_g4240 [Neonectria ditissima]